MDYTKMSLGELANLTGKSRSTIQRWKDGGTVQEKVEGALTVDGRKPTVVVVMPKPVVDVTPTPSSIEIPIQKKSEPVETKPLKIETGICHGCQEEVSELICICLNCIKKGMTHQSLEIDINNPVCQGE